MKGQNGIKTIHYLLTRPHETIRIHKQLHSENEMKITQLELILALSL